MEFRQKLRFSRASFSCIFERLTKKRPVRAYSGRFFIVFLGIQYFTHSGETVKSGPIGCCIFHPLLN